jgi:lipopolysaccharide transport system ATP-binding protein
MSNTVIQVENLSKQYRLGQIGTGSIAHDVNRWWHKVLGKEDPYLKIGEANDRSKAGNSEYVWSLRDLTFNIEKGDAIGVIGRNGAGKSTLLKILSQVTAPTIGTVKVKGRIASLLEVGTGFHPDLSGRDNIYLNGAILGMRKHEIKSKFDEIVDFAGVERYIDTPVKRYSSGMYVRLAFGVAAHLESEILIVDEVLAVGDAEFQKKCLGKMNDVSKGEGRTVLFVSHNMGSIAQLCNKGMFLQNGSLNFQGTISETLEAYVSSNDLIPPVYTYSGNPKSRMYFTEVYLTNNNGDNLSDYDYSQNIFVRTEFQIEEYLNANISVTIQSKTGEYLTTIIENLEEVTGGLPGSHTLTFKLGKGIIAPNNYFIRVALFILHGEVFDLLEMICPFKVYDSGSKLAGLEGINYGNYLIDYEVNKV